MSNLRVSLLQSEQHWRGGIHERLNRLEVSTTSDLQPARVVGRDRVERY